MRFFYVAYLGHHPAGAFLDAARLVCNPDTRHPSHVTVRGPYGQRQDVTAASRQLAGSVLRVTGPGCFFEPGQNTVYLRCDAPELRLAWDKPDFGYSPHISIYDGDSREFAERILALLQELEPVFEIPLMGLEALASPNGSGHGTLLRERLPDDLIEDLTGERAPLGGLHDVDVNGRLRLLRAIFRGLEGATDHLSRPKASAFLT